MLPSEAPREPREEPDDENQRLLPASTEREAPSTTVAGAVQEDVEAAQPRRTCRFCLGEEGEDPSLGPLITPCLCRDTVHTSCLNQWRMSTSSAFYNCGICRYRYRFKRISPLQHLAVRIVVPLWPLLSLFLLSLLLGFIPLYGSSQGGKNLGLHLMNGASMLGLAYLCAAVALLNYQYCRLTFIAARQAAASLGMPQLPPSIVAQVIVYVSLRCILVGLLFGFALIFFFPVIGFMGLMAMLIASPPVLKEVGDRLIRRMEQNVPVTEVTPEMAACAVAEAAAARAAEAAARAAEAAAENGGAAREGSAPADVEADSSGSSSVEMTAIQPPARSAHQLSSPLELPADPGRPAPAADQHAVLLVETLPGAQNATPPPATPAPAPG